MKTIVLIFYIIVSFICSSLLGKLMYYFSGNVFSLHIYIMFIYQIILLVSNFSIIALNYLEKSLNLIEVCFFIPQGIISILVLCFIPEKPVLIFCIVPFFLVQIIFYLLSKNNFYED